ncbi:MFS transporter [Brevibacterium jeotgali]|uniref:Predicted arabinose efflux permease, MFS family n=1 Tax=Brevibacterium jeotgali TaxID=1262550 RepID=A0A2H1L7I2_9MICO|nr:MFS transporter [Brevibacterium jeotgali]TWC03437.1 putative MFS family arabinose efflux permease [Brevibacterium jeotgali]SMY12866.1 Predicted arabinose efflux permease, MFS family [Brevibacterium jeotgali]
MSSADLPADAPQGPTRPPASVSAAAFVSSLDRFAISPLLVLVAVDLGATLAESLTIASAYFLAYGLSQPVWGVLSDRFGRIRLMRATLFAAAAAGVVSALAPDLATLVIARSFAGAFFGAVVPASLTYVGDTVDEAHRQPALADLMAAIAVGTALATALAGMLGELAHWRWVFAVPAVLAIGCAIGLGRLYEPPREAQAGLVATVRSAVRNRWVLVVVGLAFVEGAVVLGVLTLLAPALQSQGIGAVGAGLATAAYGLAVVVTSRMVRPVSRHLPMPGLMAIGGVAAAAGYALLAVHVSIATVVVTALLLGVTWSFLHSSLQTWVTGVLPQARGTVVALFAGCLFAGSAVGASAGGAVADAQRWMALFAVTAAVALLLTGGVVVARRAYENRLLG